MAVALVAVSCGSSSKASNGTTAPPGTASGPATGAVGTNPAAAGGGAGIKLAVNPWTGSAVNANVAKIVLETKLGTPTTLVPLGENASWVGLDAGDLDASLEVWPSGHAADYQTLRHPEEEASSTSACSGRQAKIGWYVPSFVIDQHPEPGYVGGLQGSCTRQAVSPRPTRATRDSS